MRDEATHTSEIHGYDNRISSTSSYRRRIPIAFVRSSTMTGADIDPEILSPSQSTTDEDDNDVGEVAAEDVMGDELVQEGKAGEEEYNEDEENTEVLYDEILDEEDELVERTRQLSVLPPPARMKEPDLAIDTTSAAETISPAEPELVEHEVSDMFNIPDDLLFTIDETASSFSEELQSQAEQIVFRPRHLKSSASSVRFDAQKLSIPVSSSTVRIVEDNSLATAVTHPPNIMVSEHHREIIELSSSPTHEPVRKRSSKKKRTRKQRRANDPFPYTMLDEEEVDPLDDYIKNLLEDDFEEVKEVDEEIADEVDADVSVKALQMGQEDESENYEDIEDDEDEDTDDDDDEDDDQFEDEDEDGEDDDEDDEYDESDDDLLEAERRFAASAFMEVALSGRQMKKKSKMPDFNNSDEELEYHLRAQWMKDKSAKKQRKVEREKLRQQGLLGKKAKKTGKPELKAKYRTGMRISDVEREIGEFLANRAQTTLALPPMAKNDRKRGKKIFYPKSEKFH